MKTKTLLIVATTSIAMSVSSALFASDHWENRASIFVGSKQLDEKNFHREYFEDDRDGAFGLKFDVKKQSWPVSIAIDLMSAGDEKNTEDGKVNRVTGGLHLGIRKHWQVAESIETFAGAGVNFTVAERKIYVDGDLVKDNDEDIGYWLSTGVAWKFESGINLGAEVRYSDAKVKLGNDKISTGGTYTGLYLEYQF